MRAASALPVVLVALPLLGAPAKPTEPKAKERLSAETLAGLELRAIGPAITSGRIVDVAVHPSRPSTWWVAVASGGVWKTENAGTTWQSVFDAQGSYSTGCVAVDPTNPLTVWVGSGENNSQRSVSYGDGVYRSLDGGKSWENVGLKGSAHIGKIVVHPKDGKVVWVAAQGPLWSAGGDRGLFKTTDGGKTWKNVLAVSENTGVSDVWLDPRDPDVLYATSWQRRRHVFGIVAGGPESAIHKSTDGGATFRKLEKGLPKGDVGRIGLAVAPASPDTIYAVIEAADKKGAGFYRSTDAGGSWERRGDYVSGSSQYYQELVPDPRAVDRVYSMDVFMMVTEDGGKTFVRAGEKSKHVDNHALWVDPSDTDHLLCGGDGGLYESWDRARTWKFTPNLPVTQFYRVAVDESKPFYNVYGGTQDNYTLGGPSRTATAHGIRNEDWAVTQGGDGFVTAVDPTNPDIVYSEAQYGALVRYDRKTGERVDLQPQPGPGEPPLRWNWDAPLLISPHSPTRLYFAAQRLFRSDDRGDSWTPVSPDLTAGIDRKALKVMGRVWSVDAVARNASTSFYGNIVSLAESPRKEGLLYVGTDDGLVQVSEDGGGTWRKVSSFPGVPERTYVSDLHASAHAEGTVYAAFDNHKNGDFKPYLLRSADRGTTWAPATSGLPERGTVYTVAEDLEQPGLLYAGTEFGLFVSLDGGGKWVQLKGGLPTIAVRDLALQKREGDLVIATFGRGFYVLDDLTPLRKLSAALLEKDAVLFPVKDAWAFVPSTPYGLPGKAFLGETLFTAPNPPFGAVFTTYLRDDLETRKKKRQKAEGELAKKGADVPFPGWEALRAEEREEEPALLFTVTDEQGNVVRRLTAAAKAGFARAAWDLRWPPANPTDLKKETDDNPFREPPIGPMAVPGTYRVSLATRVDGVVAPVGEAQSFQVVPLGTASLPAPDRAALLAFQRKTGRLQRAVLGSVEAAKETQRRIDHLKKALDDTPAADPRLGTDLRALEARLKDLRVALEGDRVVARANEPTPPSIVERVQNVVSGHWRTTAAPTKTFLREYDVAAEAFTGSLASLKALDADLSAIEAKAEGAGAPWTPGRLPDWKKE